MSYYNIDFYFYARLSFIHVKGLIPDVLPEQRELRLDSNHLMNAITSDLSRQNYSVSIVVIQSSGANSSSILVTILCCSKSGGRGIRKLFIAFRDTFFIVEPVATSFAYF